MCNKMFGSYLKPMHIIDKMFGSYLEPMRACDNKMFGSNPCELSCGKLLDSSGEGRLLVFTFLNFGKKEREEYSQHQTSVPVDAIEDVKSTVHTKHQYPSTQLKT